MVTANTAPVQSDDPLDVAMGTDGAPKYDQIGRLDFESKRDVWFCVLLKGVGKAQFDEGVHSLDQRRVAIKLMIVPMLRDGGDAAFVVERDLIAESDDWGKIVKPSLTALKTDLRRLGGQYVKYELVPTGTYKNKNNEEKTSTMIRFLAVYADRAAAHAAMGGGTPTAANGAVPNGAPNPAPVASASDAERTTAAKFLGTLWKLSLGDPTELERRIKNLPLTAKYFDLTSPEVLALITA